MQDIGRFWKFRHGPMSIGHQVTWRIWAPRAKHLQLILHSAQGDQAVEMDQQPGGWFVAGVVNADEGQRYAFQLDGAGNLPDPASRWQPDGVHQASALFFAEAFDWKDAGWRGIPAADLVFYELHVGTFTAEGTFDAVIPRLPELRDLGVTAIELMPVAQFPGARNWGYDGVHPFAVQNTYGGPRGLQRLVNACHRQGLALFLDVVYNHVGPEGNYLGRFGPYLTNNYQTPWGMALNYDGPHCEAVRQFVMENVRYWLREFHIDGLRLDAVHAIFDQSETHILRDIRQVAEDEAILGRRHIHIVAESNLNDVRLVEPREQRGYELTAQWNDDFHHCVHTLLTGEQDGYYSEFGHPGQLVKAMNDNFVYDGCLSPRRGRKHGTPAGHLDGIHFVAAIQNHDQIGNRALGDRFGSLLSPAQQRLAAGLLLLSPFLPLLFMGEEYGEQRPFPFFCSFGDPEVIDAVRCGRRLEFTDFEWPEILPDPQSESSFHSAKLTWKWPTGSWQAGLREWYRTLLDARRKLVPLRDSVHRLAVWYDRSRVDAGQPDPMQAAVADLNGEPERVRELRCPGVLELVRGRIDSENRPPLLAYFNLSARTQDLTATRAGHGFPDDWRTLLSSEWPQFGGRHLVTDGQRRRATPSRLMPFEVLVLSAGTSEAAQD